MLKENRNRECGRTGEMFNVLHKQYKWVGNTKIWTGLWVGEEYLDQVGFEVKIPIEKNVLLKDARPYTRFDEDEKPIIAPGAPLRYKI